MFVTKPLLLQKVDVHVCHRTVSTTESGRLCLLPNRKYQMTGFVTVSIPPVPFRYNVWRQKSHQRTLNNIIIPAERMAAITVVSTVTVEA